MFINKQNKYINYYFNFIDKKGVILLTVALISICTIVYSVITKVEFIDSNILDIYLTYSKKEPLWSSDIFDYIIPFISSIIICWSLYYDYSGNAYNIVTFYSKGKIVLVKWIIYTTIVVIVTIVSITIKYSVFLTSSYFYFILLIRNIIPVFYMTSIALVLSVFCKNTNIAIAINFIYIIIDALSNGRYPKILTIQGSSFYLTSVESFYTNRLVLFLLSVLFVFFAYRRARKI